MPGFDRLMAIVVFCMQMDAGGADRRVAKCVARTCRKSVSPSAMGSMSAPADALAKFCDELRSIARRCVRSARTARYPQDATFPRQRDGRDRRPNVLCDTHGNVLRTALQQHLVSPLRCLHQLVDEPWVPD